PQGVRVSARRGRAIRHVNLCGVKPVRRVRVFVETSRPRPNVRSHEYWVILVFTFSTRYEPLAHSSGHTTDIPLWQHVKTMTS
ncbi:MAG: hypothetical protein QOG37_2225, partial [Mycobacterium sp.]|nr:hypothetical protein [Mycobacterium sp.]